MKTNIIVILSLISLCVVQASGYTSPKIGDTKVVNDVISALSYAPQNEQETVESSYNYTAPDGWYIRSHNAEITEQRGEGTHEVSLESKPESHLKIITEYLKIQKLSPFQNKEMVTIHSNALDNPYESLLKVMEQCHQKLNLKLWAKGNLLNTSIIKRNVHVELVYLGSVEELKQHLNYQNKQETKTQPTISRPIKKIHFQTFLDAIEEVSSMLIQRMGKEEDMVFDFIDKLSIFTQSNLLNSIQFIITNKDGSIVCIVRYDFSMFNGNTYLIRRTIYGLSDFLRSAHLSIQIETKNRIMEFPREWIPTNDNIVVVNFDEKVSSSIHYSQKGDR